MRLDSESLAELRDQLRLKGSRASLVPPGHSSSVPPPPARASEAPHRPPLTPDALAVVQRVSPMCEVLYLLLMADGHSDARELELLRGAVRALTDGALRSGEIDDMLALYAAMLERQSRQDRLEQITAQLSLDRSDAEATFMLAAAMVIADETPDEREKSMLRELCELLGIARARAQILLDEVGVEPVLV
jgi:tellurite resistance protein